MSNNNKSATVSKLKKIRELNKAHYNSAITTLEKATAKSYISLFQKLILFNFWCPKILIMHKAVLLQALQCLLRLLLQRHTGSILIETVINSSITLLFESHARSSTSCNSLEDNRISVANFGLQQPNLYTSRRVTWACRSGFSMSPACRRTWTWMRCFAGRTSQLYPTIFEDMLCSRVILYLQYGDTDIQLVFSCNCQSGVIGATVDKRSNRS